MKIFIIMLILFSMGSFAFSIMLYPEVLTLPLEACTFINPTALYELQKVVNWMSDNSPYIVYIVVLLVIFYIAYIFIEGMVALIMLDIKGDGKEDSDRNLVAIITTFFS